MHYNHYDIKSRRREGEGGRKLRKRERGYKGGREGKRKGETRKKL